MLVTTFKQKISLIAFGLFLGIILLELGLRIGGLVIMHFQERVNRRSLNDKGELVILCLGESTTQSGGMTSYPRQLEWLLNQQDYGIAITVINKGISGTNSAHIAAGLTENIERYQPDIAIIMMGINDSSGTAVYEDTLAINTQLFFERFRVYKLFRLLKEHITYMVDNRGENRGLGGRIQGPNLISTGNSVMDGDDQESQSSSENEIIPEDGINLLERGDRLLLQGKLREAGEYFQLAAGREPEGSYQRLVELARIYHRKYDDKEEAEKLYKKAIAIKPLNDKAYATGGDGLIPLYREQDKWEDAEKLARWVITVNPDNFLAYSELGRCYEKKGRIADAISFFFKSFEIEPFHNEPFAKLTYYYNKLGYFEEAEQICQRRLSLRPRDEASNAALALTYQQQGKSQLAKKYIEIVDELRTTFNPRTALNYRQIIKTLLDKGVQPVCMQYPMRDVNDLEKMLPERDNIIFVDNETVFKQALENGRYDDYFVDQFAGDFGHCTPKGNRLLAENIVAALAYTFFKDRRFSQGSIERSGSMLPAGVKINNSFLSQASSIDVSSHNQSNQAAMSLTDNDPHTYWHVSLDRLGEPAWVIVDFGEGKEKAIRFLRALPRRDTPRQFFRTARLLGSKDTENWELISEIMQKTVPDDGSWKEWQFPNTVAYRYYKLDIFDGYEDGKASRFYSMAELDMLE